MTDADARDRIAKLLAIYQDRPRSHEGKNALRHAQRLIGKYKLAHPQEAAATRADHPEVARVFSALKSLLTTKPQPHNKRSPDIGELERLFTKLMRNQH